MRADVAMTPEDVESLTAMIKFCGQRWKGHVMVVFTHAEKMNENERKDHTKDILAHPKLRKIFEYVSKEDIFYTGAIDEDMKSFLDDMQIMDNQRYHTVLKDIARLLNCVIKTDKVAISTKLMQSIEEKKQNTIRRIKKEAENIGVSRGKADGIKTGVMKGKRIEKDKNFLQRNCVIQ